MSKNFLTMILGFAALGGPASAMDFTIVRMADGLRVVSAQGPIVPGDAQRLGEALPAADRDAYGNKRLFLQSIGGQVGEALAMVAVMDREKVTTVVDKTGECASACAQILFLSGAQRYVLEGGRLGLHSCYLAGKAAKDTNGEASTACNDLIAQNALAHGTGYASIMAFMQYTEPKRVRWFDAEEADCWGFTRWPPGSNRGIQTGETPPCLLRGYNGKSSGEPARPVR